MLSEMSQGQKHKDHWAHLYLESEKVEPTEVEYGLEMCISSKLKALV
jgi:hypothetical protein